MPDRALDAIAYLTGAAGPLERLFAWLRAHGIGERVVKSTIAAVLAFWVARLIPGNPIPVFAPISAIFAINLTIAGSMHGAGQRVLGTVFGVLLAMAISHQTNSPLLAIALVVFIAFFVGRRFDLEASSTQQMAVTALLIVLTASVATLGQSGWLRIVNVLIGSGIGLITNASVAPSNLLPPARDRLLGLGEAMHGDLQQIALVFRNGIDHEKAVDLLQRARNTETQVQAVRAAVDQAEISLQYNLQARRLRTTVEHYHRAERDMEHAAFHVRMMARAASDATAQAAPHDWLDPEALGIPLANLIDIAANAMGARVGWIREGHLEAPVPLDAAGLMANQDALLAAAREWEGQLARGGLFYMGQIVALCSQLATELSDPASND
jgi:uncharacterized membrane protein YgaE (UPF0421/DUF939 family)